MTAVNTLKCGSTGKGKTLSMIADFAANRRSMMQCGRAADDQESLVILDPHSHSLAEACLLHLEGNILHDRLSTLDRCLSYDLLKPTVEGSDGERRMANARRVEAFVDILLRRRDGQTLAHTPLMEEWVTWALQLFLAQHPPKPLPMLPYLFRPTSDQFTSLLRDGTDAEAVEKFRGLAKLSASGVRAEVGSAVRLLDGIFRSPAFDARCRGGFDLGGFLQKRGVLLVERGDDIGDDAMRTLMGAVVLLVVDHAKRRPHPWPLIRIVLDEANTARLVGRTELNGIKETRKYGLFWTFLTQNLDFPGRSDEVLQNMHRHEFFGCPSHDLARRAAVDIAAGLRREPTDERSRAEVIADLTSDLMTLPAGWRWVRDARGSRREYVPLLPHPYPDWPGLRRAKWTEKLTAIGRRSEYRECVAEPSESTSPAAVPPPANSPDGSSPAERLRRRRGRKRADGS